MDKFKINDFEAVRQLNNIWKLSFRGRNIGEAFGKEDAIRQINTAQLTISQLTQ